MSIDSAIEKLNRARALFAAAENIKKHALEQLEEATRQNVRAYQMEEDATAMEEEALEELESFGDSDE